MDKKEEFKNFARLHPELLDYIKNKEMSWQSFYEIYDIYGSDEKAWSKYLSNDNPKDTINALSDKLRKMDVNSIEEHLKTAQKALNVVSELTSKGTTTSPLNASIPKVPRPINKFFED